MSEKHFENSTIVFHFKDILIFLTVILQLFNVHFIYNRI